MASGYGLLPQQLVTAVRRGKRALGRPTTPATARRGPACRRSPHRAHGAVVPRPGAAGSARAFQEAAVALPLHAHGVVPRLLPGGALVEPEKLVKVEPLHATEARREAVQLALVVGVLRVGAERRGRVLRLLGARLIARPRARPSARRPPSPRSSCWRRHRQSTDCAAAAALSSLAPFRTAACSSYLSTSSRILSARSSDGPPQTTTGRTTAGSRTAALPPPRRAARPPPSAGAWRGLSPSL